VRFLAEQPTHAGMQVMSGISRFPMPVIESWPSWFMQLPSKIDYSERVF
jgi:hypothetical protein